LDCSNIPVNGKVQVRFKESKVVSHFKSNGGELGSVCIKKSSLLSPSVIKLLSERKKIYVHITQVRSIEKGDLRGI
jgi:hypothetical protein